ncbi:MAG: dTDP-4-dehydrorhamnose reductase [Methanomassiliicoccales archaeon]
METMKYLVTGASGQLGHDVVALLSSRGHEVVAPGRALLDLARAVDIPAYVQREWPEWIIHCGAYTKVDGAEDERQPCYEVNVRATAALAKAAADQGSKMLYISTDYVFDGAKVGEYEVEDVPNPINYYGMTKLIGEECVRAAMDDHLIVRISWVFGSHGENFVNKMLKLGRERSELKVVCDQRGSPTYTRDLAPLLEEMIRKGKRGTYHATNEGGCSWQEFTQEIMAQAGLKTTVVPIASVSYPTKARRPLNSMLNKQRLDAEGLHRLPHWRDALGRYLREERCT